MERFELIKIRLKLIERELSGTSLVAVSKSTDIENIEYALEAGQSDFGENRVDALEEKALFLKERSINWHFIGHLQSNKIPRLLKIPNLSFIHSVDSFKTLENLYKKEEHFIGEELGIFLQVNTSGEEEKQGFSPSNYDELARAINLVANRADSKFYLMGLMTLGKIRTDQFEEDARHCFKSLSRVRKTLMRDFDLPRLKLSMGMSRDYIIAIEEGSDFVRIGTDLFKEQEGLN